MAMLRTGYVPGASRKVISLTPALALFIGQLQSVDPFQGQWARLIRWQRQSSWTYVAEPTLTILWAHRLDLPEPLPARPFAYARMLPCIRDLWRVGNSRTFRVLRF